MEGAQGGDRMASRKRRRARFREEQESLKRGRQSEQGGLGRWDPGQRAGGMDVHVQWLDSGSGDPLTLAALEGSRHLFPRLSPTSPPFSGAPVLPPRVGRVTPLGISGG